MYCGYMSYITTTSPLKHSELIIEHSPWDGVLPVGYLSIHSAVDVRVLAFVNPSLKLSEFWSTAYSRADQNVNAYLDIHLSIRTCRRIWPNQHTI